MKTNDLFHRLPRNAHLLFIRLRSMGDCLLLTSPVAALKAEFPNFRLSVLVEHRFAECFRNNPDFTQVIAMTGKLSTACVLLTRRFDAVINLHGGPTSFAFSCLAWGRRIGAEHYQYSKLYHGKFPAPDPAVHTTQSTLDTFRWMGVRTEEPPPLKYSIQVLEREKMRQRFNGRRYVVIHPAALMDTKRWAAERFAQIAQRLQERQFTVVLTCGPGEEHIVREVAKQVPATTIMLGLTIPELAELIRGARLYVGNDSGPMHLAAAVGTPTIAIWGSSDSRRWRPWGVEHRVVQNPFECNPCPGYRCLVADSPKCIESVTVEQVEEVLEEMMAVHAR